MEKLEEGVEQRVVHSWDPQRRNTACGSPGQIGSTKHARSVTCSACLARMAEPEREPAAAP